MKNLTMDLKNFLQQASVEASQKSPDKVYTVPEVERTTNPTERLANVIEKAYNLLRKHLPDENDIVFDVSRYMSIADMNGVPPNHNWTITAALAADGSQINLLNYTVPSGMDLIINHYNFFGMTELTPIWPYNILRRKYELVQPFWHGGQCSFIMYVNGTPYNKIFATHSQIPHLFIAPPPGALMNEPEGSSSFSLQVGGDTNHDLGMYIKIPQGSTFEIWFRNVNLRYAPVSDRDLIYVGCRIRGYLRPIT